MYQLPDTYKSTSSLMKVLISQPSFVCDQTLVMSLSDRELPYYSKPTHLHTTKCTTYMTNCHILKD